MQPVPLPAMHRGDGRSAAGWPPPRPAGSAAWRGWPARPPPPSRHAAHGRHRRYGDVRPGGEGAAHARRIGQVGGDPWPGAFRHPAGQAHHGEAWRGQGALRHAGGGGAAGAHDQYDARFGHDALSGQSSTGRAMMRAGAPSPPAIASAPKTRFDAAPRQRARAAQMLTDQQAVAQQPAVHRPVEALRRATMHRQVGGGEIAGDQLHPMRHQPFRRRHAEAGVVVIGLGAGEIGPAGIEGQDIPRAQQGPRRFQVSGFDQAVRRQVEAPHHAGAARAATAEWRRRPGRR